MNINTKNSFFENMDGDFTGEDITIFKRYIEENNVHSDNSFEMVEENLNYYNMRFTIDKYLSLGSYFLLNSNFIETDELDENLALYKKSIEWYFLTVHPNDSEAVIKEEKYLFIDSLSQIHQDLIDYLNTFPKEDFHCIDILFYSGKDLYKYLPQKTFVFRWRKNCKSIINSLETEVRKENTLEKDSIWIIPILIPIREMLFLGEFGHRDALLNYGKIIERINSFLSKSTSTTVFKHFDHYQINELFGVDGSEKSILELIYAQNIEEANDGRIKD